MLNNQLAPILVSVYTRIDHFKKCINSLINNPLAGKSHLFIAIDAPSIEEDIESNQKVIRFSKSLKSFGKLTLILRNKNYGGFANRDKARNEIFNMYQKLIMFEDDNIFSPNFLSFVNEGLELYANREDIFSISGSNYPIRMPVKYQYDIYAWSGFSGWGVGIWRDKWNNIEWDHNVLNKWLKDKEFVKKANAVAEHILKNYRNEILANVTAGDTIICINLVKNNKFSIFPTITKVRNMGHDGSGEHCGISDIYIKQEIDDGLNNIQFVESINPNKTINEILRKHFKISLKHKIKKKIPLNILKYLRKSM